MQDILRQHFEKLISLTDEEFDYIWPYFTVKKLRRHQFVVQPGDIVHHEYFVVKGCIKSYYTDDSGKDIILQFGLEDWWVTDYQSFYKQASATISIDCIEDCELLCLSLHNKNKLCAELHKVEHFFRTKTNAGYVALQQRLLSILTQSARERYEELLRIYPQFIQRVPKQLIAAYLGVSRETLSRLYSNTSH